MQNKAVKITTIFPIKDQCHSHRGHSGTGCRLVPLPLEKIGKKLRNCGKNMAKKMEKAERKKGKWTNGPRIREKSGQRRKYQTGYFKIEKLT